MAYTFLLNKLKIQTRALPETINIKGLTSMYFSAYLKYIFLNTNVTWTYHY